MYTRNFAIIMPVAFLIMVAVTLLLYFWLRDKSDRARLIPFALIAVTIVGLEIAKQINGLFFRSSYILRWLPFHVCSAFILFLPLAVFLRQKSSLSKLFWSATLIVCLMGGAATVFAPSATLSSENIFFGGADFMGYHSFLFHILMVQFLMLFVALKPHKPDFNFVQKGGIVMGIFIVMIAVMANMLSVNFGEFLNNSIQPFYVIKHGVGLWAMQVAMLVAYGLAIMIAIGIIMYGRQMLFKEAKTCELVA
ncbi:MAG: YwaF family protein [Firmicutes bacterium]|nr:YwaF family protein [Bacillota bacterium]